MNSNSQQPDRGSHQTSDKRPADSPDNRSRGDAYWAGSLKIVGAVLFFWAFISLGCGVLFRDLLDSFSVGGAPLGFWMAQQGSIIGFLFLLVLYMILMNWLDHECGFGDEGK